MNPPSPLLLIISISIFIFINTCYKNWIKMNFVSKIKLHRDESLTKKISKVVKMLSIFYPFLKICWSRFVYVFVYINYVLFMFNGICFNHRSWRQVLILVILKNNFRLWWSCIVFINIAWDASQFYWKVYHRMKRVSDVLQKSVKLLSAKGD